jgi:hypothetical protein
MRDRCPNCGRFVSPSGHGPGLLTFWVLFGLIVFSCGGYLIGIRLTPPGSSGPLVINGQAVPLGGIYGIVFGLFMWLVGIVVELTHYRPLYPICRTAGLR